MISNEEGVLLRFIRCLNVPVTRTSIIKELSKHPNLGSLYAFSELLSYWNIPNTAFKIDVKNLVDIPVPFLVTMNSKYAYQLVEKIEADTYYVSHNRVTFFAVSREQFEREFTGSVLAAVPDKEAGEPNYRIKRQAERADELRVPLVLFGLSLMFIGLLGYGFYSSDFNLALLFAGLIKACGVAVSSLLLMQSVDLNNPLIERLCSGKKGNDCNAILASDASRITSWLSWSEIGFFYFTGSLVALLVSTGSSSILYLLGWLNVTCLPYTLYSVYYQARIAKKWCRFCVTIQILLWIEIFALLPFMRVTVPLTIASVALTLAALALPVLLWAIVKPFFVRSMQVPELKVQIRKFKYNADIFNRMLSNEPDVELLSDADSLILGNVEAPVTLTIVSNPFCLPCARAHKTIDDWIESKGDIKVQVVFSTSNRDGDKKTTIARSLIQIGLDNDNLKKAAVNEWYGGGNFNSENWLSKYRPREDDQSKDKIQKHTDWCHKVKIAATPTFFINGKKLPSIWQLDDIKYII